jgi:hypothetical protein
MLRQGIAGTTTTGLATLVALIAILLSPADGARAEVLAISPIPTHAARAPVRTTNPVALSLRIAERYWHAAPCGGHIAVNHGEPPSGSESGVAGPLVASGVAVVTAWTTGLEPCTITLNDELWPNSIVEDEHFKWFCLVITHELGHFLGHKDNEQHDPRSIEYPLLSPESANWNSVPGCQRVTVWYGGRKVAEQPYEVPFRHLVPVRAVN